MDKLLEILREHKDKVSYNLTFSNPEMLTLHFKDGTKLVLCEHTKNKSEK